MYFVDKNDNNLNTYIDKNTLQNRTTLCGTNVVDFKSICNLVHPFNKTFE